MDTKSWLDVFLVACGGALGAVVRHVSNLNFNREGLVIPLGTLGVNLAGCFLIGLLFGWGITVGESRAKALVGTGFLGALTTMSAFSIESWGMAENGNRLMALVYVGVTVVGCLACAMMGVLVARWYSGVGVAAGSGD